jgi:tetratricopeptide (TPR) repeat protein
MSDVYLWETYDRLGREALERQDLNQAVEAFRSAVATAEDIGSHDRLALSLRNLAATMVDQGMVSDAHELLNRTLQVATETLGDEHSQTIETQRDLARVCQELGFLDKSEGYLKAVLAYESDHGTPEQLSETLEILAKLALARDNPRKAARYYEQIVDVRTQKFGADHPEVAQSLLWLSTALYQSDQADKAEARMSIAFGIMETQFAEQPTYLAQSLLAGAQLMVESGQLEPALEHQKRALDLLSENLPGDDAKLWEARELIATTLAGLGKLEEAVELLEYCLRNQQDIAEHKLGALYKNLGGLYLTLGQSDRAEELYSQAAEILEKVLGPDHPAFLATQEERVQLYHFAGRSKEALDIALKCIKATENRFGPGHPSTAQAYASTALLAHNAEEWETALELMRAGEKIWQNLRPQPEDVLANCRTNIATCLLKLGRFDEVEATLRLAEEVAGPSLRPVIANLRQQLMAGPTQPEASPVEENKPPEKTERPLSTDLTEDEFALPDIEDIIASVAAPGPKSAVENTPNVERREAALMEESRSRDLSFEIDIEPAETETVAPVSLDIDEPAPIEVAEKPAEQPAEQPAPVEVAEKAAEPQAEQPAPIEAAEKPAEKPAIEVAEPATEPKAEEPTSSEADPAVDESDDEEFVERRAAQRCHLDINRFFELKLKRASEGVEEQVKSFFVDLAPGGLRINSETAFPAEGELLLTLPPELLGEETDLRAEVVWQKPLFGESFLQGLAFRELTSVQKHLLGKRLDATNLEQRSNSRQHYRLYRPFPIRLQADGQDSWLSSYATDLSMNGLGTRLDTQLAQGNQIRVRLELEFELPTVEVEARVAWSREGENGVTHGLQFATVGPVEAKTIKRYIDRCIKFSPD